MTVEIIRKADSKLVGYACPSCGIIYSILGDEEPDRVQAEASATACCPPRKCTVCNARPVDRASSSTLCEECGKLNAVKVEEERLAAAAKVAETLWTGPVYWPNAPFIGDHGAHYWSSTSVLRTDVSKRNSQRVAEKLPPIPMPTYVYATKPIPFELSAQDAVEAALERHSEAVVITEDRVKELQVLLNDWAQKQNVQSYEEDFTKAVMLG